MYIYNVQSTYIHDIRYQVYIPDTQHMEEGEGGINSYCCYFDPPYSINKVNAWHVVFLLAQPLTCDLQSKHITSSLAGSTKSEHRNSRQPTCGIPHANSRISPSSSWHGCAIGMAYIYSGAYICTRYMLAFVIYLAISLGLLGK